MEYKNVGFSTYSSAVWTSNKDRISFVRYDGPFIEIMLEWWSSLSRTAFANVAEPKNSPHFENGMFVVIIVLFFSYLFAISWKKIFAVSRSIGIYPISSIIRTLYFEKNLSLVSNRFSWCAFFSCVIKFSNVMK